MKIKIVSDGTVPGTHIYDQHGKEIEGVTSVSWKIDVSSKTGTAILEIPIAGADIICETTDHEN